jgi:hypothetical protein
MDIFSSAFALEASLCSSGSPSSKAVNRGLIEPTPRQENEKRTKAQLLACLLGNEVSWCQKMTQKD